MHKELNNEDIQKNYAGIREEASWLEKIVFFRVKQYRSWKTKPEPYHSEKNRPLVELFPPPELPDGICRDILQEHGLNFMERIGMIFVVSNLFFARSSFIFQHDILNYPDENKPYGGIITPPYSVFVPTLQTVIFLLAGPDPDAMEQYRIKFTENNQLFSKRIIVRVHPRNNPDTYPDPVLDLSPQFMDYFLTGIKPVDDYIVKQSGNNWVEQ